MDLTQKNFNELFIADDVNLAGTFMSEMAVGEVAMFTPDGRRLTSGSATGNEVVASAVDKARFVKKRADGTFQLSDVIDKNYVTSAKGGEYAARTEQVTYVGFNGTSGSIDVINDNLYLVRFAFKNLTVSNYNGDYFKHIQWHSPTSGTTQNAVADGLAISAEANFAREEDNLVIVEVVAETTNDAALGTGVDDVVFTNGSVTISATDIDDSTTNAAMAVGDYIRVGTTASDPVYKITAIDSSADTATLNRPFMGATQTIADTGLRLIPAANAVADDFGLQITGQALSSEVGKFLPSVVIFEVTLHSDHWVDSSVTYSTGASVGSNTNEQIAAEEFVWQGSQGDATRYGRNSFAARAEVDATADYNSYTVQFRDESEVGSPRPVSLKIVKVAFQDGASNDVWSKATDGLQAVVNQFFGTSVSIS